MLGAIGPSISRAIGHEIDHEIGTAMMPAASTMPAAISAMMPIAVVTTAMMPTGIATVTPLAP